MPTSMNCRACWVALALLWFEQTENAMLFVVIMGSVWSMVIATDNGVRHVPPIYLRAARTMGSKRRRGRNRRYWIAGGQNSLLALGTISSSSLGDSKELAVSWSGGLTHTDGTYVCSRDCR
jgi:hypothetical protein